jgi:hypothetical protein
MTALMGGVASKMIDGFSQSSAACERINILRKYLFMSSTAAQHGKMIYGWTDG